jgi:hypothetical protein
MQTMSCVMSFYSSSYSHSWDERTSRANGTAAHDDLSSRAWHIAMRYACMDAFFTLI